MQTHSKGVKFVFGSVTSSDISFSETKLWGSRVQYMDKREDHLNTSLSVMRNFSLNFPRAEAAGRGQKYHSGLGEPFPPRRVAKSRLLSLRNFNSWFSVLKDLRAVVDSVHGSYTLDGCRQTVVMLCC